MTESIQSEVLQNSSTPNVAESTSREVLVGEIDGLRTIFHVVAAGTMAELSNPASEGHVYLFTSGQGSASAGDTRYPIAEVALFAPGPDTPVSVTAADTEAVQFLELIIDLSPVDQTEFDENADKFPFFLSYSDCKTYKERIKSDKTVSRTLLPEHTFPRLCVGSVQTTGDDRVAAHQHPMLEQLFLGLKDNNCVVLADDVKATFGDGELLHIPLGSSHGVEVHEPHLLHYIWIDLFRNREGMEWIVQEHIQEP